MGATLKIGLIVDGEKVSRHVFELAQWANTTDTLCVSHLIIQSKPPSPGPRRGFVAKVLGKSPAAHAAVVLWNTKSRLESRGVARSKSYRGYEKTCALGAIVPGRIHITPQVSKSGFVHRFSDADLEKIRHEEFDILIR